MQERNISFKVDSEFYKQIKKHIVDTEQGLKEYVIMLIRKDLESNKK